MDPGNGDAGTKKRTSDDNASILAADSGDAFEFCSARFQSWESGAEVGMSTADELFCDGRIRPLWICAGSGRVVMRNWAEEAGRSFHASTGSGGCSAGSGACTAAAAAEEEEANVVTIRRRDRRGFGSDQDQGQGRWMMMESEGRREITRLSDLLSRPQEPFMAEAEEDGWADGGASSSRRWRRRKMGKERRWPWKTVTEMMADVEALKGRRWAADGEGWRRRLHLGGSAAPPPHPNHLDSSRRRSSPNPLRHNLSNDNHNHSPPPPHLDSPSSPIPLGHNMSNNNNNNIPISPIQPLPFSCPVVATTTTTTTTTATATATARLLLQNHSMPITLPYSPHPLRLHKTTYHGSSYASSSRPIRLSLDDDDGDDMPLRQPRKLHHLAKNTKTMAANPTYPSSSANTKKIKPISIDHLLPNWIIGPYIPRKLDANKPKVTFGSEQQLVRSKKVKPTCSQQGVSNNLKIIEPRIPEQLHPRKLNTTTGPRKVLVTAAAATDNPRKRLDFVKIDDLVNVKASSKQPPWNVPSYYARSSTTTSVHTYYASHIQAQIRISSRKTLLPYKQGLFNCIRPSS